jgi:hypothetical protein
MHMADLYNVKTLKTAVFDYIAVHRGSLLA